MSSTPNRKVQGIFVGLVAAILATATVPVSAQEVEEQLSVPLDISLSATSADCTNNPGPWITFSGMVAVGDLTVELIFRNNMKGTHERVEQSTSSVTFSFEDDPIQIPKQPVRGGTGGNPFIWIQFMDASGDAVSDEIFLGRCVQGFDESIDFSHVMAAALSLDVTADDDSCTNNPGPWITLSGEMSLGGLNAVVIFRNNDNPVGGPHQATEETAAEIEILEDGQTIQIPKQPVRGGVGGNPHIWVAVSTDEDSSDEIYLGRCNQDV